MKMRTSLAIPFLAVAMKYLSDETKDCIIGDTMHKQSGKFSIKKVSMKLESSLTYRNVLFWRIEHDSCYNNVILKIVKKILSWFFPRLDTIELGCAGMIGKDFYLPHRYAVINAKNIGDHVSVLQGVTIGKGPDGNKPIIGNHVVICANAVVVGGITIGDHVWIGANTFVNFDVPSNSTVKAPKSSCNAHVSKKLESMEKR